MPRLTLRGLVFGLSAASLAHLAARPQQPQEPTFRANVEYVELDAVVTDKHDAPVANLTRDDFTVTEAGVRQTVAHFQFASFPPVARTIPAERVAEATEDVVTNTHPAMGRQWVLLVDDLHLFEQNIVQTKRVVQTFLESIAPDDQVAVVYTGHSNLSHDFTSDIGALGKSANQMRAALGFASDTPGTMSYVPQIKNAQCAARAANARSTLDVVRNITNSLLHSTYPRKALVFLTNGFDYSLHEPPADAPRTGIGSATGCPDEDLNAADILSTLSDLFQQARRAGVPVYTVPPTGLMMSEDVTRTGVSDGLAFQAESDFMRVVADNTGGRAFVGRSNMVDAIHELVADNSCFYLLGYYPSPAVRDGKFHDVKVSLVGHPEYHLRAKAGYTAPRTAAASATEATGALADALGASLPLGDLSLRAFAAPLAVSPAGMRTVITVQIAEPSSTGAPIDEDLQVGVVAIDLDGKIKATLGRSFHVSAPRGTGDLRYVFNDAIDLPPQPLILRVAVVSRALGRVGSIHIPITVPKSGDDTPTLGGVVIGLANAPPDTVLPGSRIDALVAFQPTTSRTFSANDTLQVFTRCCWRSASETSGQATVEIRRGSEMVSTQQVTLTADASTDDHRQAPLAASVSLAGLAPGTYLLGVAAQLPNGKSVRKDVEFEIK